MAAMPIYDKLFISDLLQHQRANDLGPRYVASGMRFIQILLKNEDPRLTMTYMLHDVVYDKVKFDP